VGQLSSVKAQRIPAGLCISIGTGFEPLQLRLADTVDICRHCQSALQHKTDFAKGGRHHVQEMSRSEDVE
jgi:hypothetical protein